MQVPLIGISMAYLAHAFFFFLAYPSSLRYAQIVRVSLIALLLTEFGAAPRHFPLCPVPMRPRRLPALVSRSAIAISQQARDNARTRSHDD